MAQKMILDLDTGIDDALAIAYALGSSEVDLIGITSEYGNVLTERSVVNSQQILHLLGHPDIPVYLGAGHSTTTNDFSVLPISAEIHGQDGVGELHLTEPHPEMVTESAVDFILRACQEYGADLSIVATGPMTNLALAIQKDLPTLKKVGQIVIMGGALTVGGNVSPFAEANISQDPEAADLLFKSGLPVTMVGLDVTLRTLFTRTDTAEWRALGTPAATAYADMVDYYIKAYEVTSPHLHGCALHDPLAVAVAIDPSLVTTFPLNLKTEIEGPSRGRTIGNNARLDDPTTRTAVCVQVDTPRFLTEFKARIGHLLAP
nr:nucleoside hydrolase [Latilactobacillus fragifolii]